MVKNLPANAGDVRDGGSIPGSGRSSGEGHGNPLQYSCLEKSEGQRSLAWSMGSQSQIQPSNSAHAHRELLARGQPHAPLWHQALTSTEPSGSLLSGLQFRQILKNQWASPVAQLVKNPSANTEDTRDTGSIPGLGRSPGG